MNEIAETLRRYLAGGRGKTANNKELRGAVLGGVNREKRKEANSADKEGARIMRGEDDMESSGGRDREKKSSGHAGGGGGGERAGVNVGSTLREGSRGARESGRG